MSSRLTLLFITFLFGALSVPTMVKAQTAYQSRYTMMTGTLNPDSIIAKNRVMREKLTFLKKRMDNDDIEMVKLVDKPTKIMVFLGTWCPDSQRNIPPFINLIEAAANKNIEVEYIGVDRRKMDPDGLVNTYSISRVPTFVVFREGVEVGRLVERPTNTVEKDLIEIFQKK